MPGAENKKEIENGCIVGFWQEFFEHRKSALVIITGERGK